jgi:hypothetical protein
LPHPEPRGQASGRPEMMQSQAEGAVAVAESEVAHISDG